MSSIFILESLGACPNCKRKIVILIVTEKAPTHPWLCGVPEPCWSVVDEQIVVVVSLQHLRPPVQQAGALVPDHLPRAEDHPVAVALVVQDEQRPLPPDCLADVEDGRDDVSPELVGVRDQPGALSVAPYPVGAGVLQPHPGPGLGERLQAGPQGLQGGLTRQQAGVRREGGREGGRVALTSAAS